ncbi:MAG: hypothetical protein Q8M96_18225, partial [Rubrivivax sp.]|nr:hypothetical protein [Rubrivivax sp.]
QDQPYPPALRLPGLLQAALQVDTATVAASASQRGHTGPDIGQAIRTERVHRIQQALDAMPAQNTGAASRAGL